MENSRNQKQDEEKTMEKQHPCIKRAFLILAVILFVVIVIVPLLLPGPKGTFSVPKLADKDSRFITLNNITIHYKLYGKGEPYFILLHGTLMTTYTWHGIFASLAKRGTVIAYDRPSFGLTSRPMPGQWSKTSPYGYEYQVKLLLQLMDALKIKQAILIGNSMGGAIAALTAQQYPKRVRALVLADSVQSRHGIPAWLRLIAATPQMRKLGPLFLHWKILSFGKYLYRLSWHDPSQIKRADARECFKILNIQNFDRGLWELIIAAKPFEELLKPDRIRVPTFVITGDDDRIAGVSKIEDGTRDLIKMSAKIPHARLVIIPKCGHLPQEERPGQFIQAVTQFVSELPSSQ